MQKNYKKSQIAMESLMIYGLAILIVMLAVGALIYFGVLDLGSFLPDSCKIKGGNFECSDYIYSINNGLQIQLVNRAGKPITIDNCEYLEENTATTTYTTFSTIEHENGDTSYTFGNGEKIILKADNADPIVGEGQKTKVFFRCYYMIAGSTIERVSSGVLTVTVSP